MKILKYSIILLTFAGFIFMGCSDKYQDPVTPNTSNEQTATSLNKTTGPGAWIFNYDSEAAFAFIDESNGIVLTLGINDLTDYCTSAGGYDIFAFKELWLPNSDPKRVIQKITGEDITAFMWQVGSVPGNLLNFICNNEPTAAGTVKVVSKDNDYYAWLQDNSNHNTFGTKANGTLTGTAGQIYKVNLVYQAVWDGVDLSTYKEVLTIHLTQTGKK